MKHRLSATQTMATALVCSEEIKDLSNMGSVLARSLESSQAAAAVAELACSEEFRRISSIGGTLVRSLESSKAAAAVAELACSEEFRRISSIGGTLARSLESSQAAAAVAGLACSEEFRRISSIGGTLVRSLESSQAAAAVAELARSEEFRRISSIGGTLVRSLESSKAAAAVAALSRSEEFRRISSIGDALARSAEAFENSALSVGIMRIDEVYRGSITAALKANSESKIGIRVRPRGLSGLFDESAVGFTHLSHLGHVIHTEEPFSQSVAELIGDELGDVNTAGLSDNVDERDKAAMRSGLNPELIAFPHATYNRVLFSAGFRLSFDPVPIPQAVESRDSGTAFNPQHWRILNELEQRLRHLVEQRLEKLAGSNWIRQRIPQAMRERWTERQKEDRADGRPVYAAIQYADFMDLANVIMRRDNWREVFQEIFRDPKDIAVSLQRLHPVRKAVAHNRPLGRADVLTLVSEATRIFRALGMRVLH